MPTVNGTRWDDHVSLTGAGYTRGGVFVADNANQSSDNADIINTGNGSDYIDAGGGNDTIGAGNGADEIHAGAGNDVIEAGNGADEIWGGAGADSISGGAGPDTFYFMLESDSMATAGGAFDSASGDVITDFGAADSLDFSGLALTGVGAPADLSFNGSAAAAWSVWSTQSGGNTFVYADLDGDAVADMALQLNGLVTLRDGNFTFAAPTSFPTGDATATDDAASATETGVTAGTNATGNVLTNDVDPDHLAMTVVGVRTGAEADDSGVVGTVGAALTGEYGTLTLNADGTYTYAINNNNADVNALAAAETLSESFTYVMQDSEGGQDEATITVTINGANDAPVILTNGGGATANVSVEEGHMAVADVNAVDPDNGASLTYSISGGDDAALFAINAQTGELVFKANPDFDNPGDANDDNIYDVDVTVSDGLGGTDMQTFAVTVTAAGTVTADANDFDSLTTAPSGFAAVQGTANADNLSGGQGQQAMFGGAGNDSLRGGQGVDRVYGQVGDDSLDGGQGDDVMFGGSGNDHLNGGTGADTLWGGSGDDMITGGQGDDVINGGSGVDSMDGGMGADTFVFSLESDSAVGFGDTIRNFDSGVDHIDLSAFDITTADVTWERAQGGFEVSVDLDADGIADMSFMVLGTAQLDTTDFFL